MRWFWVDRFLEFHAGRSAKSIKNVSLSEEHLHDHFPGFPIMPTSLIVEGMALTAGLLAAQCSDFRERVVLAKVASAQFFRFAVPGDTLTYHAVLEDISAEGAIVSCTSFVGEEKQAEAQLFFAHLDESRAGESLFEPAGMLNILRILKVFEVGRTPDGQPLRPPQHLLDFENRDLAKC